MPSPTAGSSLVPPNRSFILSQAQRESARTSTSKSDRIRFVNSLTSFHGFKEQRRSAVVCRPPLWVFLDLCFATGFSHGEEHGNAGCHRCQWQKYQQYLLHRVSSRFSYFKNLNLPMIGSSFALPLAALTMPRTASTRNTRENRPMMLLIKYSRQEMARMIQLRML